MLQAIRLEGTKHMTTRNRVAHTATFLQTFHSGQTTAARRATVGAEGSEPKPAAPEAAAVAFVTGRPSTFAKSGRILPPGTSAGATFIAPPADGSYTAEIKGHSVKLGASYVSEAQAKWIIDIATTRELPTGATVESVLVRLEQGFAKFAGSQFITTYKDLPRKAAQVPAAPQKAAEQVDVPAGRYALRTEDGIKFYRLDRPTKGQWAGFTFLKVQASDDLYPIKNRTEKARIIAEIGKGAQAAEQLYSVELGICRSCYRTLTDETSRALGIGPECRKK